MTFLKTFEKYNKSIVSFDLDGVLHLSMIENTIHPSDYWDFDNLIPNYKLMEEVKKEYNKGNKIIIVTARTDYDNIIKTGIEKFIKRYDLPISDIILTNNRPKIQYLKNIGVIKHYDDNIHMINDFCNTGIDFILVKKDKMKKFKSKDCCDFDYYNFDYENF